MRQCSIHSFFDSATVVSLNIVINEHAVTESFISVLVTLTYTAKLKWRCSIVYRINILGGKSSQGLCLHLPAVPHAIL